jgi:hypothetical protein
MVVIQAAVHVVVGKALFENFPKVEGDRRCDGAAQGKVEC